MLGLSLKFPKIQPTLKIAVVDSPPPRRLTSPLQGIPVNIRISLMLPETRVIGLRFAADSKSIFVQTFLMGSENACVSKQSAQWPLKVIQGHMVPIESAYATSC